MKTFRDFLSEQCAWSVGWNGATISVLDNPRLVLTDSVNTDIVDRLMGDLQKIATESFGTELDNETTDGVRNHVVNSETIAFLHDRDKILGFASSKLFPEEEVFFLHGVATARSSKCRGVGKKLIYTLSNMSGMKRVAFTTQNPIMFCLLRSLCKKVYPQPEQPKVPAEFKQFGYKLITDRSGNMDPDSFVITGLYERCLYNEIPDSYDKIVNQWFQTTLKIEDGLTSNGFLFIGENG
jgi:hypothetical protein